jgi:hypothetical protein
MGVGLYLTGRFPAAEGQGPEDWLRDVEGWLEGNVRELLFRANLGRQRDGHPTLSVDLHPSAEDVELTVPEPGRLIVSAKTSTTGPGYHTYLCRLLRRLGADRDITWDPPDEEEGGGDETGYFDSGDRAAVEEEMLRWLKQMAAIVRESMDGGAAWFMLSMGMDHSYRQHGPVVTPLGPRDRAWLDAVADDPRRGTDLFPWWDEGVTAATLLGSALCEMWQKVRWRKPLNSDEWSGLMNVHLDLCRAYGQDPTLDYPWREWAELMDIIRSYNGTLEMEGEDVEPEVRARAEQAPGGPLVGYRRRPVAVHLGGGWSIDIPGEMAEEWTDDGRWSAWDGERTVWFSAFTLQKPDGSTPTAEECLERLTPPAGEAVEYRGERVLGRAGFGPYEEDGEQLWQLNARSAVAGAAALCNIFVRDPADRDWAIATWQSLRRS